MNTTTPTRSPLTAEDLAARAARLQHDADARARSPLTTTAAAERCGVHRATIIRWCEAGILPYRRTPGGQRRIDPDALDAVLRDVAR